MEQSIVQEPSWYRAIALTERFASLRPTGHRSYKVHVDFDLAKRRVQDWKEQPPFNTETYFQQRLNMDGMDEKDILCLLGEPIEAVKERFPTPPVWLEALAEAYERTSPFDAEMIARLIEQTTEEKSKQLGGFLNLVEPLLKWGRDRLRKGLPSQVRTDRIFDPGVVEEILMANLAAQLLPMILRTLTLELNVARLQGVLHGGTSAERFQSFVELLSKREFALAILQEYPTLARQLVVCVDDWVNCSLEFLQHLCTDWEAIRATFSPGKEIGSLIGLRAGVGDRHRGGHSVAIAQFESGTQIVYKPRALAVDSLFQDLLTWLNDRIGRSFFRPIKLLDGGTYGWVEFIRAEECSSEEQVRRFYERQGAYLALLWVMGATDFHYENLIAAGEYPILVDLETLWHQRLWTLLPLDIKFAEHLATHTVAESVLRVGLLPQQLWASEDFRGVDISGLGANQDQLFTPTKVIQFEGAGSDEMRVVRKRIKFPGRDNRPNLNGEDVDTLEYIQSTIDGFRQMGQLLLKHRDELLSQDGPLARFAGNEVRAIIRPTQTYALLLSESFHPDLLRDALDRERHFDRLWLSVEQQPYVEQVISAEREDLWSGNIPIFFTHPDSRDLWFHKGQRIAHFFKETSLDAARRCLQRLSEEDLERQTWFIRASFSAAAVETGGKQEKPDQLYQSARKPLAPRSWLDNEQYLEVAQEIGDRLGALALWGEQGTCWIGISSFGHSLRPVPAGADLYSGLTGISLFLGHLGALVDDGPYTDLAQAALWTARHQMDKNRSRFALVGAFSGWGGMIYSLVHLSLLWDRPDLLDEAAGIVDILPDLITKDRENDIMSGTAGCMASLFSLYHVAPSEHVFNVMVQCGDSLIARAQKTGNGVGWHSSIPATGPLAGFSHGAAGVAWALLALSTLTGEERFRSTALDAIAYERSLFSSDERNWPDLRELSMISGNGERFRTAWCHGAPGVGLGRLLCLPYLDDEEMRSEIDTALRTTCSRGFGRGHCLCHGDMGNLDVLLLAGQMLADSEWKSYAHRIAAQVLADTKEQDWRCGVPLGVETPGLMTGLAGIGYQLLRLAAPDRVPSVLAVSPPNT